MSNLDGSVRDAVDVESEEDYKDMLSAIIESMPEKIKILVDMKQVQHSCARSVSFFHVSMLSITQPKRDLLSVLVHQTMRMNLRMMRTMRYVHHGGLAISVLTFCQEISRGDATSDLDRQLARFRVLLEKKWGNDHDNTFTYIYPDGTTLRLTPHMIKEWARALVCHMIVFIHSSKLT